ncbi:DUF7587 domain-containing protein [Paucisalibacillus globulus]|uniref:DUF7587 domain-containing protein n=1 Tax=Paucisalibacillus globulus TaxID=351095 RepID=UPI0003FA437D|nr:hypothetical protein [Paucisalibacillus globulus]
MKGLKYPLLLSMLIAFLLTPFIQPQQTYGEESSFSSYTVLASSDLVENNVDEGFLEGVTNWFDSLWESIDNTIDGVKEAFDELFGFIGDLFESIDDSIALFIEDASEEEIISNLDDTFDQAEEYLEEIKDIQLETKDNIVYRVIREDEEPEKGIFAKAPEREEITIAGHVNNGSRPDFKGSKYISTTKSFQVAFENATRNIMDGNSSQDLRIVQIDLNKVTNTYYDLTDPEVQDKYLVSKAGKPWQRVRNYANKSQELLVEYSIPKEAITLLGRPSEFLGDISPGESK